MAVRPGYIHGPSRGGDEGDKPEKYDPGAIIDLSSTGSRQSVHSGPRPQASLNTPHRVYTATPAHPPQQACSGIQLGPHQPARSAHNLPSHTAHTRARTGSRPLAPRCPAHPTAADRACTAQLYQPPPTNSMTLTHPMNQIHKHHKAPVCSQATTQPCVHSTQPTPTLNG